MSRDGVEWLGHDAELGLPELCRICGISRELVTTWVEEGVIQPDGREQWRFSAGQLRRVQLACRLHQDLELHSSALPTVLDLIEEVERLRREVRVLRRMLS